MAFLSTVGVLMGIFKGRGLSGFLLETYTPILERFRATTTSLESGIRS